MFRHSGCDPISKRATMHSILPKSLPKSTSEVFACLKKEKKKEKWNKCVLVEDISKIRRGPIYRCTICMLVKPDPNWFLALVGFGGSGGLDLNAQLITAMHCTAHICNRTEWLQDFIALTSFYRRKEKNNWSWIQNFLHTLCYCSCPNDWKLHALKLL